MHIGRPVLLLLRDATKKGRGVALALGLFLVALGSRVGWAQGSGVTLSGTVRDERGLPVAGARVSLGVVRAHVTGDDGIYRLPDVAPGGYILRVTRIGFAPLEDASLQVGTIDVTRDMVLTARALPLSQVVIAPGVYGGLDPTVPSMQVLSRGDMLARPQLVEDLFRSLNRLPGAAGSDYSAKLRLRNSATDEILVTLDGMELVEPYHMKDFDGALTIVDQDAVGRVEVSSGGFGVTHGTRAAGLIQMHTAPVEPGSKRTTLGLSLSNLRARTEGNFDQGRGSWMVSARRGYLDLVLQLIGEEEAPDPVYYDILAKVQRTLGRRHVAALHSLIGNDGLTFAVDEGVTRAVGSYGNAYGWGTLQSQWTDKLHSVSLVSRSQLRWARDGQEAEFFGGVPLVRAGFGDRRTLSQTGLKQDWTWDLAPRLSVLLGGEVRREAAEYRYTQFQVRRVRVGGTVVPIDSTAWALSRPATGWRRSGYVAMRGQPISRLSYEAGVRSDGLSWAPQGSRMQPRVNVRWDVGPQLAIRGAWGSYGQAQGLQDLSVVDGDSVFARAERSEQRVVGVEGQGRHGWGWRVEAFERRIRDPRPRWFSVDGELDPFPEGQDDRVRLAPDSSRVRGGEVIVTYDAGGRVRMTAWYARTQGRSFQGGAVSPRPYEEPNAGAIDVTWRVARGWTVGAAWTARSGWPTIPADFVLDTLGPGQVAIRRVPPGQTFTGRLEGYQRLDVRLSRRWVRGRGGVSAYVEVFNALDRANQRGWSYDVFAERGVVSTRGISESFIGRLPTLGVQWTF